VRAVLCRELGSLDNLTVGELLSPVPGPGQVLIAVRAAGVNFVDGLICEGRYQLRPNLPFVPGGELAGVVSAVGEGVTAVALGDRVFAMSGFGAFAEEVVVAASSVLPIPADLTFPAAAALTQSYATVMFALTRRTSVTPGESVLVLGAGGGIGLAAADVAVALGCRVIAAASTEEKLVAARAAGAAEGIAYEAEDLKVRARELSGAGGVDVVIDPVGGRHSEAALRALRVGGRFCVIGFASGAIPSIALNLVLLNNRTLVGVDWGAWTFRDPDGHRAILGEVTALVAAGRLHPTIPAERPLSDAADVMRGLIARSVTGKVVLVP
jgi:NADPH2:quinone reductase